ncbi:MAG: hypothetical protein Q9159_006745 [Coniocarpon cinnabarinum]
MSFQRPQPPPPPAPPGSARPRYPPLQTAPPQPYGYHELRSPSSRQQHVSPMSASPSGRQQPSRFPVIPQPSQQHGAPRPQYQPHPNMHPAQRIGPPRPAPPRPGVPPKPGPPPMIPYVQQRPPPSHHPNQGYSQSPRSRPTPEPYAAPPVRGMRDSRLASSVYSSNSTPKTSPDVPQSSTFSDRPHPAMRSHPNVRPSKPRASSYYEGNPFMEQIPENPDETDISPRSRSGTGASSDLEGYYPYETRVISPLDAQPKGLGGIMEVNHGEHPRDVGLVRQASIGKRQKAALTDVRYSDHRSVVPSVRCEEPEELNSSSDDVRSVARSSGALGVAAERTHSNSDDAKSGTPYSDDSDPLPPVPPVQAIGSSWPLKTPSPREERRMPFSSPNARNYTPEQKGPPPTPLDLNAKALPQPHRLGPLSPPQSRFSRELQSHQRQKSSQDNSFFVGGATTPPPTGPLPATPKPAAIPRRQRSLKDRVGDKAPPTLDVAAVRDAEARGSLTSLPGLLNRALQLASNLERGKTSSRTSFYGHELLKDLGEKGKSTTSLNTLMLQAKQYPFPGGRGSTYSDKWPRAAGMQPSNLRQSYNALDDHARSKHTRKNGKTRRRCCGIPMWLFFLMLIVALALIVTAVVLPIALIVIPNNSKSTPAPPPPPPPGCASMHTCANGGLAVADNIGNCQCICSGSFSGPDCTDTNSPGACGSIPVTGLDDASIGSNLPPLISNAQSSYQIPLNATSILTAFSVANLDCENQNTLVNINSGSSSSGKARRDAYPHGPHHSESRHLHKRQDQPAATAAGGLVIAGPSATPSQTSSSNSASSTGSSTVTNAQFTDPNHLNFAKSAILWVLQTSQQLDSAVLASQRLQPIFNGIGSNGGGGNGGGNVNGSNPVAVDLGNGYLLDLVDLRVAGQGQSAGASAGAMGGS